MIIGIGLWLDLNIPLKAKRLKAWSSSCFCWTVVETLKGGPWWEVWGHWRYVLEGGHGASAPFLLFFQFLGPRRVVYSIHDVLLEAQSNRANVLWMQTCKAVSLARSVLFNGWLYQVFVIASGHWLRHPVLWSLLYMTSTYSTAVTYQMVVG